MQTIMNALYLHVIDAVEVLFRRFPYVPRMSHPGIINKNIYLHPIFCDLIKNLLNVLMIADITIIKAIFSSLFFNFITNRLSCVIIIIQNADMGTGLCKF